MTQAANLAALGSTANANGAITGSVLQVVSSNTTSATSNSSGTPTATTLTVSITPKFATSKIYVIATGGDLDNVAAGRQILAFLYKNTTQLNSSTTNYSATTTRIITPFSLSVLDSPATTSSTSYSVYVSSGTANQVTFNSQSGTAVITAMEIAA